MLGKKFLVSFISNHPEVWEKFSNFVVEIPEVEKGRKGGWS